MEIDMTDLTAARDAYNAANLSYTDSFDFDQRAAYEAAREDLYIAEAIAERDALQAAEIEADRKFWKNRAF
jgi:hypothetical protein